MKLTFTITGTLSVAKANSLKTVFDTALRDSMQKVGNKLAERASALAPVKTGDLQASYHASPVVRSGDTYAVQVGSDIPYAAEIHEHQIKTVTGPVKYGLGPGSAAKDAAFSGPEPLGVGGGHLVRAANYNAPLFLLMLQKDVIGVLQTTYASRRNKVSSGFTP